MMIRLMRAGLQSDHDPKAIGRREVSAREGTRDSKRLHIRGRTGALLDVLDDLVDQQTDYAKEQHRGCQGQTLIFLIVDVDRTK